MDDSIVISSWKKTIVRYASVILSILLEYFMAIKLLKRSFFTLEKLSVMNCIYTTPLIAAIIAQKWNFGKKKRLY